MLEESDFAQAIFLFSLSVLGVASASSKNAAVNDICTQEEYLKSLKEMGEAIENAD